MTTKVVPRIAKAVVGDLVKIAEKSPNLRTVSKINIKMCPWDQNSSSTKEFWKRISGFEVRETNLRCKIMTQMKHDGSEPKIDVEFNDEEKLILKGANLEWSEILYHFNAFCHHKEEALKDEPKTLF